MTDRYKTETARRASEARGYTVKLDDLAATLHDTARDLLDAELARGAPGGNIGWWARLFACELAAQRGEALPDLGTCIEYENALAAAARSGQLTMRPPRASAIAEAVTPETTDERLKDGLVALKADMLAYAEQHAPDLLGSALLSEPKTAPAEQPASVAGPGTASPEWQTIAREIADALWNKHKEMGLQGTLDSYAGKVESELRERKITGPRGEWLSAGTVKREALQGAQWWQKRKL